MPSAWQSLLLLLEHLLSSPERQTEARQCTRADVLSPWSTQLPSATQPTPPAYSTPAVLQFDELAKRVPRSLGCHGCHICCIKEGSLIHPSGNESCHAKSHHSPRTLQVPSGEWHVAWSAVSVLVGTAGSAHSRMGVPEQSAVGYWVP